VATRLLIGVAIAAALTAQQSQPSAVLDLPRDDVLIDESIPIVVSGLVPRTHVTIHLTGGARETPWTSSAVFTADDSGRIDLARTAPDTGAWRDADPMGLFWSASRATGAATDAADDDAPATADSWTLTAEAAGAVVASARLRRRAVAADVRVTPVRDRGLVGVFYEPPQAGRHPAVLVLGGSGGGVPPPASAAGGLASRGYAVLALAYFGAPGLPRALSNIPLEYFRTALEWMAAQPSVDRDRIGVLGSSRGAELALLLGSISPGLHAVVAYMPSNVIVRGCCDASATVAWTLNGRPLASPPMPMRGRSMMMTTQGPEIPVEHINGAVLLVSGRDDGVWPSHEMADSIMARLRRQHFAHPFQHLTYDHAGHAIGRPFVSTMGLNSRRHPLTGRVMQLGGTPEGTARARADSWVKMLAFLEENLRGGADASPR
jgi:dienelactone hydrolase